MACPDNETVEHLRALVERCGTLREAALELGLSSSSSAILSKVLKQEEGLVSFAKINEIRHKLNLYPWGVEWLHWIPTKKLGDLIRWRTEM